MAHDVNPQPAEAATPATGLPPTENPATGHPAEDNTSKKQKPPQRLGTAAFQTAFKNGRPQRHPLLQVRVWRRADGDTTTRVAFVVAKKLGKATFRNRLRRRMREIYRLLPTDKPKLAGCDVIFLATPLSATAASADLQAAFMQLIERSCRSASSHSVSTHRPAHSRTAHRVEEIRSSRDAGTDKT